MVSSQVIFPLTSRFRQVYQLYYQAFPAEECLPFFPLFVNSWRKWAHFEALSVAGRFVGLSYVLSDDAYVFLLFLAIKETEQEKGYGSQFLEKLQATAQGRTLLVAIEPLDASASNAKQRFRRLAFYQRYGFGLVPYTYTEKGENYQVLSNHKQLSLEAVNAFLKKVFWPGLSARFSRQDKSAPEETRISRN